MDRKGYLSHTEPIFNKHKLLMLDDIISISKSLFMFNLTLGKQPTIFNNIFPKSANFNRTANYEQPNIPKKTSDSPYLQTH